MCETALKRGTAFLVLMLTVMLLTSTVPQASVHFLMEETVRPAPRALLSYVF